MVIKHSAKKFNNWRRELTEEDQALGVVLERIWEILSEPASDEKFENGFNYLLLFIGRVQVSQNNLIRSLCQKQNIEYWDTLLSRAGNLYRLLKPQVESLIAKQRELDQIEFRKYLYAVLRHNLIRCNTELIAELYHPSEIRYPEGKGLKEEDGLATLPATHLNPSRFKSRTLEEIIYDLDNQKQARQIYGKIKAEWSKGRINVLCHYIDTLAGRKSIRLRDENTSSLHKHHQRLREMLIAWVEQGICAREALRTFLEMYLPKLCQETEVVGTYKDRKSETGENHD